MISSCYLLHFQIYTFTNKFNLTNSVFKTNSSRFFIFLLSEEQTEGFNLLRVYKLSSPLNTSHEFSSENSCYVVVSGVLNFMKTSPCCLRAQLYESNMVNYLKCLCSIYNDHTTTDHRANRSQFQLVASSSFN